MGDLVWCRPATLLIQPNAPSIRLLACSLAAFLAVEPGVWIGGAGMRLVRHLSLRKSTRESRPPPSPLDGAGAAAFGRMLVIDTHASISLPSFEKCPLDSSRQ
jgi:hypothetical protein